MGRLEGVQILRCFAVLGVVLYHAAHYVQEVLGQQASGSWIASFDARYALGVQLFFAISGFVLWLAKESQSALQFLVDRYARIYPAFWAAVATVAVSKLLIFGSSGLSPGLGWALALLPVGQLVYPLGVEWSLVYEMFFYHLLALAIVFRRFVPPLVLVAAWFAAVLIAAGLKPAWATVLLPNALQVGLSAFCIPFIAGCAAAELFRRFPRLPSRYPVLLGTALVILGSHLPRVEAHYGVLGTGFALWVLAAAQFSSSVWVQRARPLALIGDWSYAIYLLHVPVITIFLSQFRDGRTAESLFLTTVVLALCVGGICGALEVRLHRKIKGWTRVRTLQRGMALETSATS